MPLRPGAPVGETIRELYHHGSRPRSREQIIAIAEANHRRKAAIGGPQPPMGGPVAQPLSSPTGGMMPPFGSSMAPPMGMDQFRGSMDAWRDQRPQMTPGEARPDFRNSMEAWRDQRPMFSPPSGLGAVPHMASGGSSNKTISMIPGSFPSVNLNQAPQMPSGLAALANASSPTLAAGATGIPYALQMMAYQQAQQAQQLPQLQKDPEANPPPAQGFAKGGIMDSLNFKPPRSLGRVTSPMTAPTGLLHSPIPGRTDHIPLNVRHGSHVIPADVVSGFGQGNSLAGARNLDRMMRALPQGYERGGHPHEHGGTHEPILAAGGEYVVAPEDVTRLGKGDAKRGHDLLDKFILHVRKKTAKTMLKLPGPKK